MSAVQSAEQLALIPAADDPARHSIGGNKPPPEQADELDVPDLITLLNPGVLRDQLLMDYADHVVRRDELVAGVDMFFATVKKIHDDATMARATDFAGQIKLEMKAVEADRVREVAPLRAALDVYQKVFKAEIWDVLSRCVTDIEAKQSIYAREIKARNRQLLEEQVRKATAEADAARAKAELSQRPSELVHAAKVAATAEKIVHKAATATTASLGRSYGNHGPVAVLKETWTYEVVDIELVEREWMCLNVAKVVNFIADGARDKPDGTPCIRGLRILSSADVKVRP